MLLRRPWRRCIDVVMAQSLRSDGRMHRLPVIQHRIEASGQRRCSWCRLGLKGTVQPLGKGYPMTLTETWRRMHYYMYL